MNRRKVWIGAVAGLAFLVVFSAWLPGYRLERELAAARAEGLWTEAADVRAAVGTAKPEENAAPLVHALIAEGKARGIAQDPAWKANSKVLKGTATPAEVRAVRALCAKNADLAARWRAAAARPRLVFDRPWEDGYAVLYPEFAPMKDAVRLLCASAHLGFAPQDNLRAAARLSALVAQEPTLIAQIVSVSLGKFALREAKHEGMEREVEAALGPPFDVRRLYAFEFYDTIQTMRRLGSDEYGKLLEWPAQDRDWGYRLRHTGPWKANAIRHVASLWRDFWREMPQDGTDYPKAIHALEHRMFAAERATSDYDAVFDEFGGEPDRKNVATGVKTLQKYEADRETIRR